MEALPSLHFILLCIVSPKISLEALVELCHIPRLKCSKPSAITLISLDKIPNKGSSIS